MPRHEWDRQPNETLVEYQRFLCYLSIGATRTINRAYRNYCKQVASEENVSDGANNTINRAPGNWQENAVRNRWVERSLQYDISRFRTHGNRLAVLWVHGFELMTRKAVIAASKFNPGDKEWNDVINTFKVIATQLSPDGVRAIAETAGQLPEGEAQELLAIATREAVE